MPLAAFWSRHCNALMSPRTDLPAIWQIELMRLNRGHTPKFEFVHDDDDADLTFIPEIDDPQL